MLPLDDRAERRCGLAEERIRDLRVDGARSAHDGRVRLQETLNARRPKLRATEEREARAATKHGLCLRPDATARLPVAAEREDALETTRRSLPERNLGQDVEPEEKG